MTELEKFAEQIKQAIGHYHYDYVFSLNEGFGCMVIARNEFTRYHLEKILDAIRGHGYNFTRDMESDKIHLTIFLDIIKEETKEPHVWGKD